MRTWDRLSATFVKGLKRPGKFYDGGGLMLSAAPTRRKGEVRSPGCSASRSISASAYMGLGSARVVSLAEARAKANEARKLLAAGIDPITHRDAERWPPAPPSCTPRPSSNASTGFLESHGDRWRTKHLRQWQNSMATYAKPLFEVAVGDIDVALVLKVIEPEWKRAPQTMDRVRRRIGEVLGCAEVRGFRKPGPLPTRWKNHLDKLLPHPRSLKPVVHHAALAYDAVPALYRKLVATDAVPELCLAFTILTATRSQEARGARWDEIDFKARTWTVPPSRMKRSRAAPGAAVGRGVEADRAAAAHRRVPVHGQRQRQAHRRDELAQGAVPARRRRLHGSRLAARRSATWADEHTNYPRELQGGRARARHRQPDRSGICKRRSSGTSAAD